MAKVPGTSYKTLELPENRPLDDDPCWCQSGEKFANCHLDRDIQKPPSKWELLRQIRKLQRVEYCSHPMAASDTCAGGIINAHTLQLNGPLKIIAAEGHVYGVDLFSSPDSDGHQPYKKIGVRRASTFGGFCARHDTEFFRPLEVEPFVASKRQLFLLAYRALSKEIYTKRFAISAMSLLRKADIGKDSYTQVITQKHLFLHEQALRLSLEDLETSLRDYKNASACEDFDRFSAYLLFTDRSPNLAVCGGLQPEFDFQGQPIQDLSTPGFLDFITYTVMPIGTSGVVAFVWDSESAKSCERLVTSLDALPNIDIPDALVRMTYEHFENAFASPKWWESLSSTERTRLTNRHTLAASPVPRRSDCL